jgi:hypothetical protein
MRLRSDGLTWREVDGETVLLDLESSIYLTTNRTGTFLLRQLTEERSRPDLIAALTAEYGVDEERAGGDVDMFVDMLEARHLLAPDD